MHYKSQIKTKQSDIALKGIVCIYVYLYIFPKKQDFYKKFYKKIIKYLYKLPFVQWFGADKLMLCIGFFLLFLGSANDIIE